MKTILPLLVLTAGCMVGPDYHTPSVCLSESYDEEGNLQRENFDLATWWRQFEDPQLEAYVETALQGNLDFAIALHRVEEVRALYHIERSFLYPQIDANILVSRNRQSSTLFSDPQQNTLDPSVLIFDTFGPGLSNFFQIGFDAVWELDFFGKNRRRAEAGYRDFQASQEEALFIQVTLVSDVARFYIDIRALQNEVVAKKEQVERQKELVNLTEARYCAGLANYLDVTRAQAALSTEESELYPLESQLKELVHGLAVLLGRPPEGFAVEEGEIPKALGKIPEELPSTLLRRRPDIRQVERQLAAATSRIGVAKADLFPSFSLIGSFGTQSNELSQWLTWPSRFWTIGPSMMWNVFSGGKIVNQIAVANERQKQLFLRYEQTIYTALKEVEDRLVGYRKQEERLISLEDRLSEQSLTRDLTYDQYLAGLISFDQVVEAERNFYLSRQEMIQSQGLLMTQLVGLYKALGGGWQCSDLP